MLLGFVLMYGDAKQPDRGQYLIVDMVAVWPPTLVLHVLPAAMLSTTARRV